MGWNEDSFEGKAKFTHMSKAKHRIHSLLHSFPWCSATPGRAGSILCDRDLGRQMPPTQTSPSFIHQAQYHMGWNMPWSAVPAVSFLNSLCLLSSSDKWVRKGLDTVQALLSNNEDSSDSSDLITQRLLIFLIQCWENMMPCIRQQHLQKTQLVSKKQNLFVTWVSTWLCCPLTPFLEE